MKRRLLVSVLSIALILSMATGFSSCSKSNTGTSSTTSKSGTDMTLMIFLNPDSTEDPRNAVLKQIVEDYNKNNTMGNTVKVETENWQTFEEKAIQAAAGGKGPDIINIYTDMLKQHIAGNTVQPMTKYAEDYIKTLNGYVYSADSLKINGEIYTMPWESRTFVYWYRKDVFTTPPKSLEELASVAGSKASSVNQGFVIGLSEEGNGASLMESFVPFLRSAGGTMFDDSGKAAFNSAAGVKALNFIKSLVDKKAMDTTTRTATVDTLVDAFKAGTVLSMNAGTQRAANIRKSDLSSNIASIPILGFADGKNPSPAVVAGQSLGIGKFAKNPEAAFDFIKTFFTTENQVKWLKANVLPVIPSVYDNADIKALSNYNELKTWYEYSKTGQVEFYPENYKELSQKMAQAAQRVVFEGSDAQKELDSVATWYNGTVK